MTPLILGLSHVSLSVADRPAARRFWGEVMGFECLHEAASYCFMIERGARIAVILSDHGGTVRGPFDERQTGLDHLALAVADPADLLTWDQRLAALGVEHSPIAETDGGYHLNLRAPDNLAIELFVMKPEFAAQLGLIDGAVAATH
ncbi:glyoxalase/bleomycin resistance protein/dioxygenase [Alloactinosynnema sp. L-07]|uniref:VOC family protein n=1 Tax=Alloactinosynnema sp. L-07 TaxID=1653480 RepID=UPI00065F04D8|nr:VOC family protein [Alloactinosynnema sp. L-07]CRK61811.1 glyoxalase/bleomycin resistance protein/dioxygenase [Alloactinosynnema sp. L-07]